VVKDIRAKVSGDAQLGLWSYASLGNKKLNDEKESFSGDSHGGIIGYNLVKGNGVTFVPFIRMNRTDVIQKGMDESDQGNIDKIGLGVGFWLENNGFFVDSVMLANYDKYNTSRTEIEKENDRIYKADGRFEGSSGIFETKAGYIIPLKKDLRVTPYIGFDVAYI
jgi:outer membrane autotransporter protein